MILIEAKVNARWSLDFINDQLACGRPVEVPLSIRRPFSCRAERQQLEVGLIGGASVKARVWPAAVVQRGLLTPTELSFVNCSTGGIRGLVFGSAFSQRSRRRTALFFRCNLTGSDADRWLEIPAWMFERSACATAHLAADARTDLAALTALASLLRMY